MPSKSKKPTSKSSVLDHFFELSHYFGSGPSKHVGSLEPLPKLLYEALSAKSLPAFKPYTMYDFISCKEGFRHSLFKTFFPLGLDRTVPQMVGAAISHQTFLTTPPVFLPPNTPRQFHPLKDSILLALESRKYRCPTPYINPPHEKALLLSLGFLFTKCHEIRSHGAWQYDNARQGNYKFKVC